MQSRGCYSLKLYSSARRDLSPYEATSLTLLDALTLSTRTSYLRRCRISVDPRSKSRRCQISALRLVPCLQTVSSQLTYDSVIRDVIRSYKATPYLQEGSRVRSAYSAPVLHRHNHNHQNGYDVLKARTHQGLALHQKPNAPRKIQGVAYVL